MAKFFKTTGMVCLNDLASSQVQSHVYGLSRFNIVMTSCQIEKDIKFDLQSTKGNKFDNDTSGFFTKLISRGQPIWESKGSQFPKWFFCKLQTTFAYLHNILNHSLSDDLKM
jgi:hypothetical protein